MHMNPSDLILQALISLKSAQAGHAQASAELKQAIKGLEAYYQALIINQKDEQWVVL